MKDFPGLEGALDRVGRWLGAGLPAGYILREDVDAAGDLRIILNALARLLSKDRSS